MASRFPEVLNEITHNNIIYYVLFEDNFKAIVTYDWEALCLFTLHRPPAPLHFPPSLFICSN